MNKLVCLLLALFAVTSHARTISWRSGIFDTLLDSSGGMLDDTFTFELGAFDPGFTPDALNFDQWSLHWHAFGQATYEPINGNGWEPSLQYFTKDTTVLGGQLSSESPPLASYAFTAGMDAWLWVYDNQAITPTSEWALVRGSTWDFPASDLLNLTPVTWELNSADISIWGGANDLRGAGEFSSLPALFDLQTAVVPEPGSAALMGIALCLTLRRRRPVRSSGFSPMPSRL
ncbi:MAG: PEP-CTERM sorting domain-containing protein [Verrucomicrobiaceae bacterium]|nr:PEP-CTERM sorting domain-containing protein [Verrucomicrobiaceae bacterium]